MSRYFEHWPHKKWTGKKCVICWTKLSHQTHACVLCREEIEFCNDCMFENGYQQGEVLEGHLENEHSSVNLC